MPRISAGGGVILRMYYDDHPPPHFHARYGGEHAVIGISPVRLLEGELPRPHLRRVLWWARHHRRELLDNWDRARDKRPLVDLPPPN
jgi:hypothetical protein